MINAKQARELANVSDFQMRIIMDTIETAIKDQAAKGKLELLLTEGPATTEYRIGERPQATATMLNIKARLEDLGYRVSFEECGHTGAMQSFHLSLTVSNMKQVFCTRISW